MKFSKVVIVALKIILGIGISAALIKIFLFDTFQVKGVSMNPVLLNGERITVNKSIFGARIYTCFDFSQKELHSFRAPGFGDIQVGDIIVFNYPMPYNQDKIEFRINYVYAKRCIGRPGDIVGINNGYFYNTSLSNGFIIGSERYQKALSKIHDTMLAANRNIVFTAVTLYDKTEWTIKNLGPVCVPSAGQEININVHNLKIYEKVIEYESGYRPTLDVSMNIQHNGCQMEKYTFKNNYYYLCGDNVFHSNDSRYFGFVPEDYIIGVAVRR